MDREEQCRHLHHLPAALRDKPQWLLWRFETYAGDAKPRKVPYYAGTGRKRTGKQGSAEDRGDLVAFDLAVQRLQRGSFDGIGFAFLPGDGLVGIDIDHAINPDTGEVSERCQAIIAACASYTEITPSGTGVHIICLGEAKTRRDNAKGLEIYSGRQYFTCTGRVWNGSPAEVVPIADTVLRRLELTMSGDKPPKPGGPAGPAAAAGQVDDFARVNAMALALLDTWVPSLFPDARKQGGTGAWRVTSKALGRDLQEDLSLHRDGINDYGTEKGMTPIDVVVEFAGKTPKEALHWLAAAVGARLESKGKGKPKPPKADPEAEPDDGVSTPSPGSAEEGEGPPGGPPDDDPPPDDDSPRRRRDPWAKKLLRTTEGGVKDCRENVFYMLTEHPVLQGLVGFNEFAYQVIKLKDPPWESTPGEWTNHDDYELGLWLSQQERHKLIVKAEGSLVSGVAMAAFRRRFHPVRQYLQSLAWDGTPRLDFWVNECLSGDDTVYNRLVGRWFLMGMVNRILNPGCQMDNMVIMEGEQGRRKSSALRILAGEWFADTPIKVGDKDALLNLAGIWLYEIAELDSFSRAEVTAVKQYVSSREDRVREPYARRPATRKRECVLGGTTNQHEYFKDPTGSRRFWPIAIRQDIDLGKLAEWRDQLFAEAMVAVASGERYYPTREEAKEIIEPEQDAREITDPWFERISVWVDADAQCMKNSFTSADILVGACHVPIDKMDGARQMATRVGICMHKLKWKKERDDKGARLWRYYRPGWSKRGQVEIEGGAGQSGGPDAAAPAVDGEVLHEF